MRKKRPLDRSVEILRDTRLVVIASEDKFAVRQYFEFFKPRRIQFKFLETLDGKSSPEHVFERLERYLEEFDIGPDDRFWFVSDTDHWAEPNHIQNFVRVIQLCRDKGIGVAVSNPCFELWLLLHFVEMPTAELTCTQIAEQIRTFVGKYNKTKVHDLPIDDKAVENAIRRSTSSNSGSGEIPAPMETRVHLIIDELLKQGFISIEK